MIYSLLRETKREPRISRNGSSIIMGATLCLGNPFGLYQAPNLSLSLSLSDWYTWALLWLDWLYGHIMLNKPTAAALVTLAVVVVGFAFYLCIGWELSFICESRHNGAAIEQLDGSWTPARDLCDYFNAAALRQKNKDHSPSLSLPLSLPLSLTIYITKIKKKEYCKENKKYKRNMYSCHRRAIEPTSNIK